MQLHRPSHEPPGHRRNGPGQGPAQQCPAPAAAYGSLTYPVAYLYLHILCHDYKKDSRLCRQLRLLTSCQLQPHDSP